MEYTDILVIAAGIVFANFLTTCNVQCLPIYLMFAIIVYIQRAREMTKHLRFYANSSTKSTKRERMLSLCHGRNHGFPHITTWMILRLLPLTKMLRCGHTLLVTTCLTKLCSTILKSIISHLIMWFYLTAAATPWTSIKTNILCQTFALSFRHMANF